VLDALFNSVLPIFAMVGVGMAFGRFGLFDTNSASAINRFVFYVGVPVLMFRLLASNEVASFDWPVLFSYLLAESVLYAGGFVVFRFVFQRGLAESFLLAMAIIFANHLMYVLPIAVAEFGAAIEPKITSIILVDVVIFYGGNVVLMEVIRARSAKANGLRIARLLLSNPQLIAIVLGIAASVLQMPLDNGLGVFATFVGNAAAPCSLFALGVVMSAQKYSGGTGVPWLLSGAKLLGVPVLVLLISTIGMDLDIARSVPAILVAAGPVGAMPFVLALQYGQPVHEISRAILISTLLSLVSIALVMQLV